MNSEKLRKIENIFKSWDKYYKQPGGIAQQATLATDLSWAVDDAATFDVALKGIIERTIFPIQACFVTNVARMNGKALNTNAFAHWCEANAHEFRGKEET
jgi:hypothetical protein